jgi:hypothetical protein
MAAFFWPITADIIAKSARNMLYSSRTRQGGSEEKDKMRRRDQGYEYPSVYSRKADQFMAAAEKLGVQFDYKIAQTRSVYVEVFGASRDYVFRFSNHADAYATAYMSIDPFHSSYKAAKKELIRIAAEWKKDEEAQEEELKKLGLEL